MGWLKSVVCTRADQSSLTPSIESGYFRLPLDELHVGKVPD
jgi:hypothetical protein